MHISLRLKLFALGAIGMVGAVTLGITAARVLSHATAVSDEVQAINVVQRSQMYADMMHDAIRGDFFHALVLSDSASRDERIAVLADNADHVAKLRSSMHDAIAGTRDSTLIATLEESMPALDAYVKLSSEITSVAVSDKAAARARQPQFDTVFSALEDHMDVIGKSIVARAQSRALAGAEAARQARTTIITFTLAVVLAIGLLCWRLGSRVSRAVVQVAQRVERLRVAGLAPLQSAATSLAAGELLADAIDVDATLLSVDSDDEIGAMAGSVNAIVKQTQSCGEAFAEACAAIERVVHDIDRLVADAAQGRLQSRADESRHAGTYRTLVVRVNQMLDAIGVPLDDAAAALAQVAARDLTARMRGDYQGQFATVASSMNDATTQLHDALSEVQSSAEQVSSAGQQIASGSTALAHDASAQAATLAKVSEQLRELAASSARSLTGVQEADQAVGTSRTQAAEGRAQMQKLSEAMGEIRRASDSTAKIVKTIDEIAFQTNLLALNAAVEAARAGDSGKGFAVVADEVRTLAMRSAEAAKSTASLIEESVRLAAHGVAINEDVVRSLDLIERSVVRASDAMHDIGLASTAQSAGVSEVERAMQALGDLVQRGAANAEESAASAEELQAQSATLVSLVNTFEMSRPAAHVARPRLS